MAIAIEMQFDDPALDAIALYDKANEVMKSAEQPPSGLLKPSIAFWRSGSARRWCSSAYRSRFRKRTRFTISSILQRSRASDNLPLATP